MATVIYSKYIQNDTKEEILDLRREIGGSLNGREEGEEMLKCSCTAHKPCSHKMKLLHKEF